MARNERGDDVVVITDAPTAHSDDLESRQKRYALTMLIRTLCFVALFFVHGWWRVGCVAGAALLPGFAVVLANARDNRTPPAQVPGHEDHGSVPMLTPGQVIRGEVVEDHPAGTGGASVPRG